MSRIPTRARGMTIWEAIIVFCVIALLIFFLQPNMGRRRGPVPHMENSRQLRGIHQAMVTYSNTNGGYFPGLDAKGHLVPDGDATGHSGDGTTPAARFWILMHGGFMPPIIAINPMDKLTKWTTGSVSTQNFSYAMLQISDGERDAGRLAEWRDNANWQAILAGDRNIGTTTADADVSSVWTTATGSWMGSVVWGDNHAEFVMSNRRLTTRYHDAASTNDNLFLDGPTPEGNPATERGTTPGSNAMMVWY